MTEQKNICLSGNNSTLQPTARPSEMGKIFSYNGNSVMSRERAMKYIDENYKFVALAKKQCDTVDELLSYLDKELMLGDEMKGSDEQRHIALKVRELCKKSIAEGAMVDAYYRKIRLS